MFMDTNCSVCVCVCESVITILEVLHSNLKCIFLSCILCAYLFEEKSESHSILKHVASSDKPGYFF